MSEDREDAEKAVALWLVGATVALTVSSVVAFGIHRSLHPPEAGDLGMAGLDPMLSAQISHASPPPSRPALAQGGASSPPPAGLSGASSGNGDAKASNRLVAPTEKRRLAALPGPDLVIYFELGETQLPPNAEAELAKLAGRVKSLPRRRIVIAGFHDATGSKERNRIVARERARSVRAALLVRGVPAQRILLTTPSRKASETAHGQLARRVEIRLMRLP